MDVSALPYLYCFIIDCALMLIGGFVRWQQGRKTVWFSLAWLGVDAFRCFVIMASAGDHAMLDRNNLVWFLRLLVVIEHTILASMVIPFVLENTTLGKKKSSA